MKNLDFNSMIDDLIASKDFKFDMKEMLEKMLNQVMKKERSFFLNKDDDNKGNGSYDRSLNSGLGKLALEIPRDRNSKFRPFLLPEPYQRNEESYSNLVNSLFLNSYSPNKIKSVLKTLNLPYSDNEINELKNELLNSAKEFKNRELPEKVVCIYIDAYHCDIKDVIDNKIKQGVIYTVLGIDLNGKKEVYGFYPYIGHENKGTWISIFNNLIERKLSKPSLIISDDFSGIKDAIKTLFPKSDHQLCYVHLQRNIKRNMGRNDAAFFNEKLTAFRINQEDFSVTVSKFETLCNDFKDKYPAFIKHIISRKNNYFMFLNYPKPIRKHIYTTNPIENFNSKLEIIRYNSGGFFHSFDHIDLAIFILIKRISNNKWAKILPHFRMAEYEIHQLFNKKFIGDLIA
jgi:transposase-like protein